jgi:hypothetical protein
VVDDGTQDPQVTRFLGQLVFEALEWHQLQSRLGWELLNAPL